MIPFATSPCVTPFSDSTSHENETASSHTYIIETYPGLVISPSNSNSYDTEILIPGMISPTYMGILRPTPRSTSSSTS